MLPVDPRRPEKVQRYAAKTGNGQEDLTPDYMNILGQQKTTANAGDAAESTTATTATEPSNLQVKEEEDSTVTTTNNVIPTSPQYGVAITTTTANNNSESTATTDTVTDTTAKPPDETKDLQSTPSRNDRFKVVKIASLEPFKRGRWKCMDYVDEQPPNSSQSMKTMSNVQISSTGAYLQTQSMPQQQIHQYLVQGGFTNGSQQYFPNVQQTQMIPQNPYFYQQQVTNNIQTQTLPQQFNQPYFVPQPGFTNVQQFNPNNIQYVPIQNQNSAFVPTSQLSNLANFQQSQTYAGQPLVNGHNFQQPEQQQQQQNVTTGASLPTQTAKSVLMNVSNPQQQMSQQQLQNSNPQQQQQQTLMQQGQQYAANPNFQQQQVAQAQLQQNAIPVQTQAFDANAVYAVGNAHFAMTGSLANLDNQNATEVTPSDTQNPEQPASINVNEPQASGENLNQEDPAKTNPVVNAIDNKIEQAMDLVKSHLMYTVREEVEVLKEKISELMEKIQQLETENNQLKSQISNKPPVNTSNNQQQSNTNPSPIIIPNTQQQNPENTAPTQLQ